MKLVFFLSLSGGWKRSIFFIGRWRLATFLNDSFKFFLFPRTFQMEKDKNNCREYIDKKLDGRIFEKYPYASEMFLNCYFFIPIIATA